MKYEPGMEMFSACVLIFNANESSFLVSLKCFMPNVEHDDTMYSSIFWKFFLTNQYWILILIFSSYWSFLKLI